MRSRTTRFVLALLITGLFASPANASLIWEFGFVGEEDGFSGEGSFELNGPRTSDGLAAFSFVGTCSGFACEFGLADVLTSVSDWELVEDWTFLALELHAEIVIPEPLKHFTISLFDFAFESSCSALFENNCDGETFTNRVVHFPADEGYLRPRHTEVPEPTTLALLSLGLVGLGMTRRKMKG